MFVRLALGVLVFGSVAAGGSVVACSVIPDRLLYRPGYRLFPNTELAGNLFLLGLAGGCIGAGGLVLLLVAARAGRRPEPEAGASERGDAGTRS